MKTIDDQIAMLNTFVLLKLAPSPIHGIGVFAVRDIPKGTKLYADNMPEIFNVPYERFDEIDPVVGDLLLGRYPLIVNGSAFLYPDARMLAYMNHSDTPNYADDRALRDIEAGEEITEDYRTIPGHEIVFTWLQV